MKAFIPERWRVTSSLENEDRNDGTEDSIQGTTGLGPNGGKKDGESWIQETTETTLGRHFGS